MDGRRRHRRWWALCLTTLGTSACATLVRSVAEEAVGDSGPARTAARPEAAATRTARDAPAAPTPEPAPAASSTYESTPMMGLSTLGFSRPYSLMGSLFARPGTTPACRIGARNTLDVLHTSEESPVDVSAPLGLRVARPGAPVRQAFTSDPELRSARAFHSGAVLSGEGRVCGRSFANYYFYLALGWDRTEPVAVSR